MRLLILYGSQTGTAQDVAEQIWRASKNFGFTGPVLAMDEYPIDKFIEEHLIIFVIATTGDGDEPDNMKSTWKFLLRKSLPANSLHDLQYACLGLGDSSYAKFNYAAKKFNKRIQQLGGEQLIPLGLCDDQHDYGFGAVAFPWIDQLWQKVEQSLGVKASANRDFIFKWRCNVKENCPIRVNDCEHLLWPHKDKAEKFVLQKNKRTTCKHHFQDVRLLQFKFSPKAQWNPGDILQVQPQNSTKQVDEFFLWAKEHNMNFGPDTVVEFSSLFEDMPLPKCYEKPLTVREMATYVWDLSFKPRQRAFELLALKCDDELEKEKLIEFTTVEGLDSLISYINRPRRTIMEVLQDFRHASSKLTLDILVELFTIIQPRSFSIASCKEYGTLDILVAVVEYKTKLSLPRLGLCSNWLKSLSKGIEVFGCLKPGTMKLPKQLHTPLIMVGPGTGIAPFRSILQSRYYAAKDCQGNMASKNVVYFGCRNKSRDFHFSEDLEQWQSQGLITLHCAFSRDQDDKVYVQHLIEKSKEQLAPLILRDGAFILVAGSSKNMPKSVREAFINVLDGQEDLLEDMVKHKRYQEETWS